MDTTVRLDSLKKGASMGVLTEDKWRPEVYMEALESSGFTDVRMKNKREKLIKFQAIFVSAVK